jgi:hypothetical protein
MAEKYNPTAALTLNKNEPSGSQDIIGLIYPGAMYSGCGGSYLYVASDTPVPGAFHIKVRIVNNE